MRSFRPYSLRNWSKFSSSVLSFRVRMMSVPLPSRWASSMV